MERVVRFFRRYHHDWLLKAEGDSAAGRPGSASEANEYVLSSLSRDRLLTNDLTRQAYMYETLLDSCRREFAGVQDFDFVSYPSLPRNAPY